MGLENNIPNSFLNGVVFFFWSISGLKEAVLTHFCNNPLCVTCELRFLFRMFDQGLDTKKPVVFPPSRQLQGIVVHATNFYRMLAHHPDSIAFGILDKVDSDASAWVCEERLTCRRAERFIQFVLSQMMKTVQPVRQIVGITTIQSSTCAINHATTKENTSLMITLNWWAFPLLVILQVIFAAVLQSNRPKLHLFFLLLFSLVRIVPQGSSLSRHQTRCFSSGLPYLPCGKPVS